MAFNFRKNLDGSSQTPALLYGIGKNSVVFTVGDTVRFNTSGFIDLATTTEQVYGIVAGVVDSKGIPVAFDSGAIQTWTMASDNQTVSMKQVAVIPAFGHYAFSADSDTTIEQASLGKYFALNSTSDGIVTSGESDTIGSLDCQLVGLDPDGDADASKGLYRFVNSQVGQLALGSRAA
jgi:hypothetical protein